MTKEEAKHLSDVLKAYSEDKAIEIKVNNKWVLYDLANKYQMGTPLRIKPEPKYRPYANTKEFLKAQKEHGLYVQLKDSDVYYLPTIVSLGILFNNQFPYELEVMLGKEVTKAIELLEKFQWQDGHPTGILEE